MEEDKDDSPQSATSCRCCLVENICKNIASEYCWNGQYVIYADLLRDTFGISLSSLEGLSLTICDNCISRLIDATEFKHQVQDVEANLTKQFAFSSTDTDRSDHKLKKVVMKREKKDVDDVFGDGIAIDNYDCDTLLTGKRPFAIKGGKKTAQKRTLLNYNSLIVANKNVVPASNLKDVSGLPASSGIKSLKIGNRTVYVKLRHKGSLPKQVTAHNIKNEIAVESNCEADMDANKSFIEVNVPIRSDHTPRQKLIIKSFKGIQQQNKSLHDAKPLRKAAVPESSRFRRNRECMVLYTTMYPFRLPPPYHHLVCVYCGQHIEPADYRTHIDQEHPNTNDPKKANKHNNATSQIKVECSDLKCRICDKSFDAPDVIALHLYEEHNKDIDLAVDLGVAPFKFKKGEALSCAFCQKQFANLITLSKHTSTHFSRFICDQCGKSYSLPSVLKQHRMLVHADKPKCIRCKATFETPKELTIHHQNNIKCRTFVCTLCKERFVFKMEKRVHLAIVHGIEDRRARKCLVCQKEFPSYKAFARHNVQVHFTDSYRCETCGKKFGSSRHLTEHTSIHTGATPYHCEMCEKSYSNRKCLAQHIRINHRLRL